MNIRLRRVICAAILICIAFAVFSSNNSAQEAGKASLSVGDTAINASLIKPGKVIFKMIVVNNGQERETGTLTDEISLTEAQGKPAFLRVEVIRTQAGTLTDKSTFLRSTLAPVSHRSLSEQREMSLDFTSASVKGSVKMTGGEAKVIEAKFDAPVFDSTVMDVVVRALPLREGYTARYPIYLYEAGGQVWANTRVTGSEMISTSDQAKIATWVVENTVGETKFTLWIARETRELMRLAMFPQPGFEMRMVR